MKINISAEFSLPAFSIPETREINFPGFVVKSNTDVDCTEEEFKLFTNCAHELSKEWLPIKKEIVQAIFGPETFKALWKEIWASATDAVKKLNPFRTQTETE